MFLLNNEYELFCLVINDLKAICFIKPYKENKQTFIV